MPPIMCADSRRRRSVQRSRARANSSAVANRRDGAGSSARRQSRSSDSGTAAGVGSTPVPGGSGSHERRINPAQTAHIHRIDVRRLAHVPLQDRRMQRRSRAHQAAMRRCRLIVGQRGAGVCCRQAARLLHDERARGRVPLVFRRQRHHRVISPVRDQRHAVGDRCPLADVHGGPRLRPRRMLDHVARDQNAAPGKLGPRADLNGRIVQRCTAPLCCYKHLFRHRIVDHGRDRYAVVHDAGADRELVLALDERQRPVDRIDDKEPPRAEPLRRVRRLFRQPAIV